MSEVPEPGSGPGCERHPLLQAIKTRPFQVTCRDGVVLRGQLYLPEEPKAVVQFNCGTATQKFFYAKFLTYLAEHGYATCLWDYRGSGDSAPADLSEANYRYADYGAKDIPAVRGFLREQFPDLPFLFVGHSAGGQQVGVLEDLEGVRGALMIAVSTGYFANMPLGYRLQAYFFFYVFTPLSLALFGYVASKRFGFMEDLPEGVVTQWRAWCTREDYFFDPKFLGSDVPANTYRDLDFPIRVYFSPDDTISNRANTQNFWRNASSSAGIELIELDPKQLGGKPIGHFGYFRSRFRETLWPRFLAELDGFLSDPGSDP